MTAPFDDISNVARLQLKIRVLDALGCAIGAMGGDPVALLRDQVEEFDGGGSCTLIGGGKAAAERASFYNGALVVTWTGAALGARSFAGIRCAKGHSQFHNWSRPEPH